MKILKRQIIRTEESGMYLERTGKTPQGQKIYDPTLVEFDGRYEVALPHSCDQWTIAYGDKEKCIEELSTFIREAQQILGVLVTQSDKGETK